MQEGSGAIRLKVDTGKGRDKRLVEAKVDKLVINHGMAKLNRY